MENVTVLKDEVFGVEREYREVKRKAAVGERIKIVSTWESGDAYEIGDVLKVDRLWIDDCVECDDAVSPQNDDGMITGDEYVVLEPTDIVRVDGGRFRLVDRKPTKGERIIVTKVNKGYTYFSLGDIGVVKKVSAGSNEVYVDFNGQGNVSVLDEGEWYVGPSNGNSTYAVLVPAEYVSCPQPTEPRVGDVLSNGYTVYAVRPTHRTVGNGAGFAFANAQNGLTYLGAGGFEWWSPIDEKVVVDDSRDDGESDQRKQSTFEKGSRVKITGHGGDGRTTHFHRVGSVGTVEHGPDDDGDYDVVVDGTGQFVNGSDLEAA